MADKKQRLDKYYKLAKEKGFRCRAAFKLLELNRKFDFLKNANIAIDLCAAPGGWMQVLSQHKVRKVVGIDLDYIRPIPGCVSIIGDITHESTRLELMNILENREAGIVVHDGAPNASKFEMDAYNQNVLVLKSLKLATEFLKENGTFVTKIFRSENFSKIVDLLKKLFNRVNVTKPMSSRDSSVEIFAVCLEYKNLPSFDYASINENIFYMKEKLLFSDFVLNSNIKLDQFCGVLNDLTDETLSFGSLMESKAKVIKMLENGEIDIPNKLKGMFEEVKEEDERKRNIPKPVYDKKDIKKSENITDTFYNDNLFRKIEEEEISEDSISVESSDSLSMTESEKEMAIFLKENPESFVESTVDKNMNLIDYLPVNRSSKMEEKVIKKKIEYLGRKKIRALRRTNKRMEEITVEEENEPEVYRKILRKNMKRKNKRKLVRCTKGGVVSKGAKLVDRRMKNDRR